MLFEKIENNSKKYIFSLEPVVTFGSGAPPDPGSERFRRRSVIHSELEMLLLESKRETSNNVTKCLGLGSRDEQ